MTKVNKDKTILSASKSTVLLLSGESKKIDISLSPISYEIGSSIQGFIKNSSNFPIENAFLEIIDDSLKAISSTYSDSSGFFLFNNIPPSLSYKILIKAKSYLLKELTSISLAIGEVKTINITLEVDDNYKNSIIYGKITDSDDSSIIDTAIVSLHKLENGASNLKSVNYAQLNGEFIFREVPIGDYEVKASSRGYASKTTIISVPLQGSMIKLNITLTRDPTLSYSTVSGVVRNSTGVIVPYADVFLYKILQDNSELQVSYTKTNESGLYAFVNVPIGKYRVLCTLTSQFNIDIPKTNTVSLPTPSINKITLRESIPFYKSTYYLRDATLSQSSYDVNSNTIYLDNVGAYRRVRVLINADIIEDGSYRIEIYSTSFKPSTNISIYINDMFKSFFTISPNINDPSPYVLSPVSIELNLSRGTNSIAFLTSASDPFPEAISHIIVHNTKYEKKLPLESSTLQNNAQKNTDYIYNIGPSSNGFLTYNFPILNNQIGKNILSLRYFCDVKSYLKVNINNVEGVVTALPPSSYENTIKQNTGQISIPLNIPQDSFTLKIQGDGKNPSPNILISNAFLKYIPYEYTLKANDLTILGSSYIRDDFIVNIDNLSCSGISFRAYPPKKGLYDLEITYVSSNVSSLKLYINDSLINDNITFNKTESLNIQHAQKKIIQISISEKSNTIILSS